MNSTIVEDKKSLIRTMHIIFMVLALVLTFSQKTLGQTNLKPNQNLAALKVDELSDEQVINFYQQFVASGMGEESLQFELEKRKLPASEITKIANRIEGLKKSGRIKTNTGNTNIDPSRTAPTQTDINPFESMMPKIFGAELFNNPKLSFEPNLKMATPLNYQLGPDDELIIDIFGYSEQSYQVKVSPEGHVRIPNLGPVQVLGLTVDQAQKKITAQLIKLYPRIASGETSVSVNLGSIRSIKVTILGEVNLPGTYSLPSLATTFNGLYASGGPNLNGSFRNIKLVRANKVIAKIDMYDFLINGNSKGNIPLKDQDVIKVEPYESRVELKGYVKREGFFEVLPKENLSNLLAYAGGFTPSAYTNRIKVVRNNGSQKSVADVEKTAYAMFFPKNGDVFMVDSILNRYENRISIEGAVFRPGYFSLEGNNSLKKLIANADGLKEDAFTSRATIVRRKMDNSLEVLSVDLNEVLNGSGDVALQREDKVSIASKTDMKESYSITITGQVLKPGKFPFAENMHVEDLIIMAGGLKEAASLDNIQIAQRINTIDKKNLNSAVSNIIVYNAQKDLKSKGDSTYVLKPYDVITILAQAGYQEQKQVIVNGEVMFPGTYVLSKSNEHISDLLKRAGGLTAKGFPGGAILIRAKGKSYQDAILKDNKIETLRKQSKDTSKLADEIEREVAKTVDIVGINLDKILKNPGSKEDLLLRENDVLEIPFIKQTVLVSGQVLYPVRSRYTGSSRLRRYVSSAGGFSSDALRRRTYVVYANGTAKDTRNFLFIKFYPKVKPGCEIVVPVKETRKAMSTIEAVTIASSLTSMLLIISTLLK